MRPLLCSLLATGLFLVGSAPSAGAQVRADLPVFKSKTAKSGVVRYTPVKGLVPFDVVIRLYIREDDTLTAFLVGDELPWSETISLAPQDKKAPLGPKELAAPTPDQQRILGPLSGSVTVLIGATEPLPTGLNFETTFFTTQVVEFGKGKKKQQFEESPGLPLGQVIAPLGLANESDDLSTVSGGANNTASGAYAVVGGGSYNRATGLYATVGGGYFNTAPGSFTSIAGGYGNTASGALGSIGGGELNRLTGPNGVVAGGRVNSVAGTAASVGGGYANSATDIYAVVAGGANNRATGGSSAIGGGSANRASGYRSVVGGGAFNTASDLSAAVGGGVANTAAGTYSTVAGGQFNSTVSQYSTVGGGRFNTVLAGLGYGAIAGGQSNTTDQHWSSVGGGSTNLATGVGSRVGGGFDNQATGYYATVAGGRLNTAAGNFSAILGGANNNALAAYSFAGGRDAIAGHKGAFVWGDSSPGTKHSVEADSFNVYARGGSRFFTDANGTVGVGVAPGSGSWSTLSDRNMKDEVTPVDSADVLARVLALPIATWRYKTQDGVRHMGPMAQDFHAAFGLGVNEKLIDQVDPDGVALAAIQGLAARVAEKDAAIEELRREKDAELAEQRAQLNAVHGELAELRALVEALSQR